LLGLHPYLLSTEEDAEDPACILLALTLWHNQTCRHDHSFTAVKKPSLVFGHLWSGSLQ
jgi:hypothetical protein